MRATRWRCVGARGIASEGDASRRRPPRPRGKRCRPARTAPSACAGTDPGDDRQHRRQDGRHGAQGPATRRGRSDEDGRVVTAPHAGIVRQVTMAAGDVVREGYPLVFIQQAEIEGGEVMAAAAVDLDRIRPDLEEAYARHALTLDGTEPEAGSRSAPQARLPHPRREHRTPGRSSSSDLAAGRCPPAPRTRWKRCATRPATAWWRGCARSTATCLMRRGRARRWCATTIPCWPARGPSQPL